jgi:hypothetical protein
MECKIDNIQHKKGLKVKGKRCLSRRARGTQRAEDGIWELFENRRRGEVGKGMNDASGQPLSIFILAEKFLLAQRLSSLNSSHFERLSILCNYLFFLLFSFSPFLQVF